MPPSATWKTFGKAGIIKWNQKLKSEKFGVLAPSLKLLKAKKFTTEKVNWINLGIKGINYEKEALPNLV